MTEGYRGGKSAVYELVRKLRPAKAADGVARFEAVPGEFCQHDFGQLLVRYEDGRTERVRFFASRLKYSRMARVLLVEDERTETVCRGVADAYTYFGGMPLIGVFDNPRTIVSERNGKHVRWQETFAQFTVECGFSPLATWPRRPREKGSVENLVGFAKSNFFQAHRFGDCADLETKLAGWHQRVNEERPCRATGEVTRVRLMLEAERLRPLGIVHVAAREGDLEQALDAFVAPDVLVVDELGYLSYGPDAANSLFQVVDRRYLKHKPIVITSNKEPASWRGVLHDPDLAEAIVDRLEEHGEIVRLKGKSYRRRHAESARE